MCFHVVIKTITKTSIFGSAWRKYEEKMEITGESRNIDDYALKLFIY